MTTRFIIAHNALKEAFFNNLLIAGDCTACAVGNIIANAQGGKMKVRGDKIICSTKNIFWTELFCAGVTYYRHHYYPRLKKKILKLTGYTWEEMAEIERAFENSATDKIYFENTNKETFLKTISEKRFLESQLQGLLAVIDTMAKMDKIPKSCTNGIKKELKKHPGLQ